MNNLISSQSNYPLQTVIKGDSVVILTKKQANEINDIFESQTVLILKYKAEITYKDSLIAVKDTLLIEKTKTINNFIYSYELAKRLDLLEHWMFNAAINNTWIYYSWKDSSIYAVDLSQYYVRKDNREGHLFFYRADEPFNPEQDQDEPPKGWENDFVKPKRPVITKVPIKL